MNKKEILKINKKNNIDSIIEAFQHFGNKYDVRATRLEKNIQYKIKKHKITQTYKTTLLKADVNEITKKLKNKGRVTIIVIDNLKTTKDNERKIKNKIRKINSLEKINTKITKKNNTFKTLESILEEECK